MVALEALLKAFYGLHAPSGEVRVSFIGGGEPLLSPRLVERGMSMARRMERERGIKTSLGLVTNGSLLSDTLTAFLAEVRADVEVSFDVLRDVQEAQRGDYASVAENVRKASRQLHVSVRTVATQRNVERLEETARECVRVFPGVRVWRCDPELKASGREFFLAYTRHFTGALAAAQDNGWDLRVENTVTRCLTGPADRFCERPWVAGPTGEISSCPCDDGTGGGVVGCFDGRGVKLKKDLPEAALMHPASDLSACAKCFLRWNCAGGCPARRRRCAPGDWSESCRSQRAIAAWVLAGHATQIWGKDWARRKDLS